MAGNAYQHVGFHFSVHFYNADKIDIDAKFQSVSGLDSTLETETIKEGGENRFEHVVPTRRKFGPLILKRGILGPKSSQLGGWLKRIFEAEPFDSDIKGEDIRVFDTVTIKLLGEDHQVLLAWTVNNVWPRSWKVAELNAEQGSVLIETLELNYNILRLTEAASFNPPPQ